MKKMNLPLVISLAVIAVIVLFSIGSYNGLASSEENVNQASAKVETALQRRYDLIPNVVNSVKGYMKHEEKVFSDIAAARAKIGSGSSKEQAQGQSELDSAISRLLVLTENYPELKADQQVSKLITELEGAENRIFVARNDYNQEATSYNKKIRRFPGALFARIFGFERKNLFNATPGAENAPSVNLED